jgi:CHAD domain-containing protein
MKLKSSNTAAANVRALLPKKVEKYFRKGRVASNGKRTPTQLHQFRIATKRFRYTLEIFRPVYGASLDSYLDTLHDLQHTLGQLSDYRSIGQLLDGDKEIGAKLQQASSRYLAKFHEQWKQLDAPGNLEKWQQYLASGNTRIVRSSRNPRKPAAK